VSFAVDLGGSFGIWRVAKTENLPSLFVHPILVIMNAILVLDFNILGVSFGNVLGADAAGNFVNIHVQRHRPYFTAMPRHARR
jgi:hypothetical protein